MLKKFKFTRERIENCLCPKGYKQILYADSATPNLLLRVTRHGAKTYVFEAKLNRKTIRMTIGDSISWYLDDARKRARELKTLVDKDIDPRIEIAQIREKANLNFKYLYQEYVNERKGSWSERHLKDMLALADAGGAPRKNTPKDNPRLTNPGLYAQFLELSIAQINRENILKWINLNKQARPTMLANASKYLSAFINWLKESEKYSHLYIENPIEKLKASIPNVGVKSDKVELVQLQDWFRAVNSIKTIQSKNAVLINILTGARPNEVLSMQWKNINWAFNFMTIKDKEKGMREIPLTPYVKHLLNQLPKNSQWVFAGENGNMHTSPMKSYRNALKRHNLPHVTLHGLRRTFKTLGEYVRAPEGVINKITGHAAKDVSEKHYMVREREWLLFWHARVELFLLTAGKQELPEGFEKIPMPELLDVFESLSE